jgi:5,10-methylene-tetrahydrofolate dehydrogenase/methenyl tetrahydrofolate cyclohydrolase
MEYTLLNGKDLASRMKQAMAKEVAEMSLKGVVPGLAVVLVACKMHKNDRLS